MHVYWLHSAIGLCAQANKMKKKTCDAEKMRCQYASCSGFQKTTLRTLRCCQPDPTSISALALKLDSCISFTFSSFKSTTQPSADTRRTTRRSPALSLSQKSTAHTPNSICALVVSNDNILHDLR